MKPIYSFVTTRVGKLLLVGEDRGAGGGLVLRGLFFADATHAADAIPAGACEDASAFVSVALQIDEYLRGWRTTFDVPLEPRGTEFQLAVWRALRAIPYGATTTYAAIARTIGRPRAVRAVGAANGKNPLSIVVPCHRVIGGDGSLTGYAGGLAAKKKLLEIEGGLGRRAGAV
jgi:methylated-DNA-[protein]-cysteine S-methyltransferase